MELLRVMTVLNIAMLFANIWMRIDSEKIFAELKKRIYSEGAGTGEESFHRACGNGPHFFDKGGKLWADEE